MVDLWFLTAKKSISDWNILWGSKSRLIWEHWMTDVLQLFGWDVISQRTYSLWLCMKAAPLRDSDICTEGKAGGGERETWCPIMKSASLATNREALGEGNGNPLRYSCLENPMDRGAWWAAQSWTWLKWLSSSSSREVLTTRGWNLKLEWDVTRQEFPRMHWGRKGVGQGPDFL